MVESVVGIDVGGTFTDLVLQDSSGGITLGKVPSTPADQSVGIMAGLRATVPELPRLKRVAHGTTVSTNALLQGRGGPVAMVTTAGFRDTLEIGRTRRMLPSVYDPSFVRPPPLVPRPLRFEVAERLAGDGAVLTALDEKALAGIAKRINGDARAVAVCFLHSWADARHERRAAELLRTALPGIHVTASADVIPEFREYERFSTAVINAFLLPVMDRYLAGLDRSLTEANCGGRLVTMSSAGGTLDIETVRRLPVRTILSGPAGGVTGALWVADAAGLDRFITCDMGGTSTDVCLIEQGRPALVSETAFAGYPLKGLQYDINTVGAGGGSIAHAEADGILKVGPISAGAEPGPAGYGRGGSEPTVTDANLVLGRLGTGRRLGASIAPSRDPAEAAIGGLAQRLELPMVELAEGILRVAVARMAGAIRAISIEKGRDPADFTLLPFGGAGPMHACDLAEELGIREVLVPICPGNLSALGLLVSDQRQELVRTCVRRLDLLDAEELANLIRAQEQAGHALPLLAGLPAGRVRFEHALDMRYARQAFEVTVPLAPGETSRAALHGRFIEIYRQLYGHADSTGPVEIVTLRTVVIGVTDKPAARTITPGAGKVAVFGTRRVKLRGDESDWPVVDRAGLGAGDWITGPAIVEEANATTVVLPDWSVEVDRWGNLRLTRR
ncbi:MAG: hydantoinase/oxoprolinase family protein [Alphaproteobacteria bacterium]|nr:hydantoinase/oxoprolinase family protein [Alphaproteobacteria bacterium]